MLALPRVRMLEQRRAVELREAVRVLRKVPGHPVQDDAQPRLVTRIDEILEVFRRAEAAGGREESQHLIAPGARKRMLHHRQQLDVREAVFLHVGHQAVRHFLIREKAIVVLGHARPRPEMHLVNRHRTVDPRVPPGPGRHPSLVAPHVAGEVPDDRRRLRRHLERHAERIALLQDRARARANLELVLLAVGKIGDEDFPDAGRHEQPHGVHASVPAVEVADQADAIGIGRPHREVHADGRADSETVGAELLEDPKVPALAEQVEIEIAEHTSVPVRIVNLDHVIAGKRETKAVIEGARIGGHARRRGLDHRLEETGRPARGHRHQLARRGQPELDRAGGGMERPHDDAPLVGVGPENGERIAVHTVRQGHDGRRNGGFGKFPVIWAGLR